MTFMKKKILSVVLAIAILASVGIIIERTGKGGANVLAGEYRSGFLLVPNDFDSLGVLSESSFTLKSQTDYSLTEIVANFSIDNMGKPQIILNEKNTFTIIPNSPLEKNKLYTFRMKTSDTASMDITWTFQSSAQFLIAGTLPANKTSNVPIDTGIEIYFSHSDYQDIDNYFEIIPSAKGRFERHKNTYVFVPDKQLSFGTLYTIKIKKGVKTSDGKTSLSNDFIFSFETAVDANEQQDNYDKGYIFFNKILNEYNTSEKPYLPINYYFNSNYVNKNANESEFVANYTIKANVYSYNNVDGFLAALDKKGQVPTWAYYSYLTNNYIETKGLVKVMSFDNNLSPNPSTPEDRYLKIPDNLVAGYYIVDCTWGEMRFQTFIEVTDIGFYMTSDDSSILIWLNDLKTKKPISNATITLKGSNLTGWKTDENGVAKFDYDDSKVPVVLNDSGERYFKIESIDGKSAVLRKYINDTSYYNNYMLADMYMPYYTQNNNYWRYTQLDRSLYKPNDTVNFWGLIKNRYASENIVEASAEIVKSGYYPSYSMKNWSFFPSFTNDPVAMTELKLTDGTFNGNIEIPYVEPGNYSLRIKVGEKVISETYMTVENYTKPAYKMEIEANKKAVFWYEPVEFTLKTSFFEGTKVPGLDVNYNITSGYGNQITSGTTKTDKDGQYKTTITPGVQNDNIQGETQANFFGSAALPETGQIQANSSLRVFTNDINVAIDAIIKGSDKTQNRTARIEIKANKIVLDKINAGTNEDYADYLGAPQPNAKFSGSIIKNRWIKYKNRTYYDYINKKTSIRYDYKLTKETVSSIEIVTDNKGFTYFEFGVPDITDGYYTYELNCKDNKDRSMKFQGYIGEQWYFYNQTPGDDYYYLEGAKENYKEGSDVTLNFKKGLSTLPQASYLYIKSQNKMAEFTISDKPTIAFKIAESDIPNVFVRGVYFNGTTYVETSDVNIVYDFKEKELLIKATTDKESYKPGEDVVIKITSTDRNGKHVRAIVNAGIVDEALFKLQDMTATTLASLYEFVPSGIKMSYSSHINSGMDLNNNSRNGYVTNESYSSTDSSVKSNSSNLEAPAKSAAGGATSDKATVVREKFSDTALFQTIILSENGDGEIRFKLPDNITSWRITLTGISLKLDAGSNTETIKVTLPFFINYSFNKTYLAGDKAAVGITGYGNNLDRNDTISYKVSTSSNPNIIKTATAKAFERINIPLELLTIDDKYIIIEAQSSKGDKDAIKHLIDVKESYHEVDESVSSKLTVGMPIKGGKSGNTRLVFLDKGRGQYYQLLGSFLWQSGNRIDQHISRIASQDMIEKYFTNKENINSWSYGFDKSNMSFKASDYQTTDGGIALLPYGSSDLLLSAKIAPFVKDSVDLSKLKQYFYSVYGSEEIAGIKAAALYGLAVLREPVLTEIGKATRVSNATLNELLYLSLAYCELGEWPLAQKIFKERIEDKIKISGAQKWIDSGVDKDDTLESTALGMMLTSYFDLDNSRAFYNYCTGNSTSDILVNLEMLSYVRNEIVKATPQTAEFTYTYLGKTTKVTLDAGFTIYRDIPSKKIGDFKISSVTGGITLISTYKNAPTSNIKTDSDLKVTRNYYNSKGEKTNTFAQDEIVRVEIDFDFNTKSPDGSYEISDFLPSGLKPLENTWMYGDARVFNSSWYGRINGQKITFDVYNFNSIKYAPNKYYKIIYYARVVSTGTYTAESPIIQGNGNLAGLNFGNRAIVVLK